MSCNLLKLSNQKKLLLLLNHSQIYFLSAIVFVLFVIMSIASIKSQIRDAEKDIDRFEREIVDKNRLAAKNKNGQYNTNTRLAESGIEKAKAKIKNLERQLENEERKQNQAK